MRNDGIAMKTHTQGGIRISSNDHTFTSLFFENKGIHHSPPEGRTTMIRVMTRKDPLLMNMDGMVGSDMEMITDGHEWILHMRFDHALYLTTTTLFQ
jgi:hypothetical protein